MTVDRRIIEADHESALRHNQAREDALLADAEDAGLWKPVMDVSNMVFDELHVRKPVHTGTLISTWDAILETFNKRNLILTAEIFQGCTQERQDVLMAELDRNMAQLEELRTILSR